MKRAAIAVASVATVGACLGAAATVDTAHATAIPLEADFGVALPGQSRRAASDPVVPVPASLTALLRLVALTVAAALILNHREEETT